MAKEQESRSKNWATVVYPESAPENWMEKLNDLYLEGFVSPLHDSDCEEDGEIKKAHFHVLMKFPSMKSREQILDIVKEFGGVGAERIANFRSYSRYLCHLDQPHKFQYDIKNVVSFGGADYQSEISSVSDKYLAIADMLDWLEENRDIHRYSFNRFLMYCRHNNEAWFRALCDNCSYIIRENLASMRWTDIEEQESEGLSLSQRRKIRLAGEEKEDVQS